MALSNERGMVTVELAVATLAATVALVLLAGVWQLVVLQMRLGDLASETARQAARGDTVAVERARRGAPDGAKVTINADDGQVHVRAEARQTLPVGGLTLHADAWVVAE
ncbi:TadE family type IV pilus minor pilin [Enemella sp. A6]|uniref:TadE family type IV pilus minor pilin n=1 Tax=Enemella sp. A6 TaxID=3440152 RepID=UPI003EBA403A